MPRPPFKAPRKSRKGKHIPFKQEKKIRKIKNVDKDRKNEKYKHWKEPEEE